VKSKLAGALSQVLEYDFRNSIWGMTKAEVKLSEKAYPLSENETHITYKDTVMNIEATIGFRFIDDSLIEAGYAFREAHKDRDLYIRQFERVKVMLTRMYGEPLIDKNIGKQRANEGYPVESDSESDSHMFIVEWHTRRSAIRLLLVDEKSSSEFGILHLRREHDSIYKMSMN